MQIQSPRCPHSINTKSVFGNKIIITLFIIKVCKYKSLRALYLSKKQKLYIFLREYNDMKISLSPNCQEIKTE